LLHWKNNTNSDVEKAAENWFNGAKDRAGGREKRRKPKETPQSS
jgi:hypothetical protein